MNKSGSIYPIDSIPSVPAVSDNAQKDILTSTPPTREVLPLLNDEVYSKKGDNNSKSCLTTSGDENNNKNNNNKMGCGERARKGLTNAGGWICRQFFKRIINNIADAAWNSLMGECFSATMESV